MRENADQNNSENGHFSHSGYSFKINGHTIPWQKIEAGNFDFSFCQNNSCKKIVVLKSIINVNTNFVAYKNM